MNSFDKMMRQKANSEKISVPDGFDGRIDGIIACLSRKEEASLNIRDKKHYRPRVLVASICLVFMMFGYMSIIGFDRVYATIAKAVPYVVGFGRTDSTNSNDMYAIKDDVIFYDSLGNKYTIKSAFRKDNEVRIILVGYLKTSIKKDTLEQFKTFKLVSNGVEYTPIINGEGMKPNGIFSKYKSIGDIDMSFFYVPESESLTLVYDSEKVPLKLEKVIDVNQKGIYAESDLYKITLTPVYNKNMVGVGVFRKDNFPLSLNKKTEQSIFIDTNKDYFFEDDKGKKYKPYRFMQRNEFLLDKGNISSMKYFIVDRIRDMVTLDERDYPDITFKMPKIGETIDINYRSSIDGFAFTIISATKRLFKQEYKYQVNNEELSITIEFNNLPQDLDIDLTPYFGQNHSYSVNCIKRGTGSKVLYEYVFHNDSGAITPSSSNFLDNTELEMRISGYTIFENVNWRFELK